MLITSTCCAYPLRAFHKRAVLILWSMALTLHTKELKQTVIPGIEENVKNPKLYSLCISRRSGTVIPAWSPERLRCGGAAVKKYSKESLLVGSVGDQTVSFFNCPIFRCSYTNIQDFFEKTNKNLKNFLLK